MIIRKHRKTFRLVAVATCLIVVLSIFWLMAGAFQLALTHRALEDRMTNLSSVIQQLRGMADWYEGIPQDFLVRQGTEDLPQMSWRAVFMWLISPYPPGPAKNTAWTDSRYETMRTLSRQPLCETTQNSNVFAVTGEGTIFSDAAQGIGKVRCPTGLVVMSFEESDVNWMEPFDITTDMLQRSKDLADLKRISGRKLSGKVMLGFWDSEVVLVNDSLPSALLLSLAMQDDCQKVDRAKLLQPFLIKKWQ